MEKHVVVNLVNRLRNLPTKYLGNPPAGFNILSLNFEKLRKSFDTKNTFGD